MKVLSGITVLDRSTIVSDSFRTQLLDDTGVDVINVEPITSDPIRSWRTLVIC